MSSFCNTWICFPNVLFFNLLLERDRNPRSSGKGCTGAAQAMRCTTSVWATASFSWSMKERASLMPPSMPTKSEKKQLVGISVQKPGEREGGVWVLQVSNNQDSFVETPEDVSGNNVRLPWFGLHFYPCSSSKEYRMLRAVPSFLFFSFFSGFKSCVSTFIKPSRWPRIGLNTVKTDKNNSYILRRAAYKANQAVKHNCS